MMNLIKSDFKKIFYLPGYRKFLAMTIVLSILFGAIFLFTIGITQGKQLTELTFMEVIDISFLGMDVTAIMLIIFTGIFISKDLASGAVHTNLAITPVRKKFFFSRILFLSILSILISITVAALLLAIGQLTVAANDMNGISAVDSGIFLIIGSIIMVLFYSLLSAAGTFYFQSTAGGITFALVVMFLPALIRMFPADVSDPLLAIFPENALHSFLAIDSVNGSLALSAATLLAWMILSFFIGLWKFERMDY